jgi:hypothetical protein
MDIYIEGAVRAAIAERRGGESVGTKFEWPRWWRLTPPPDQVILRVHLRGASAEVLVDWNYLLECARYGVAQPEVKALIQQTANQLFMMPEAEQVRFQSQDIGQTGGP